MDLNKIEKTSNFIYLVICISLVLSLCYYFYINLGVTGYLEYYAVLIVFFFTTYYLGIKAMDKAFAYTPKKKKSKKKAVTKKSVTKKTKASTKKKSSSKTTKKSK